MADFIKPCHHRVIYDKYLLLVNGSVIVVRLNGLMGTGISYLVCAGSTDFKRLSSIMTCACLVRKRFLMHQKWNYDLKQFTKHQHLI
jgi:hypothetical protein